MAIPKAYATDIDGTIRFVKGNFIDGFTFTVLAVGGGAFDFTGASSFELRFYNSRDRNRRLIASLTSGATELAEAAGIITVTADFPTALNEFRKYPTDLLYIDTDGEKIVGLFDSEII